MSQQKPTDRWNAEHYKKHSEAQFRGALEVLNEYPFRGDEDVLDIGCGDGRLTAQIAAQLPEGTALGIDASENMIQSAQQEFQEVHNLSFVCARAENFMSNKKYDLVVSFHAFHYIENQPQALQNIYSMLKPGGTLFIRTAGGNAPAIEAVFDQEEWKKQFPVCIEETWHAKTAKDYQSMLTQSGFENITIDTIHVGRFFESAEAFIGYAMGWVPYVTGLSPEKSLAFSRDLADSVKSSMKREDPAGRLELITPMALIWAQKPARSQT